MCAAAAPALPGAVARARVASAARELQGEMARLRSEAIVSRRIVAMRLEWSEGRYRYSFYADGDGDGVRADDIAGGRDARIGAVRDVRSRHEGIDFGLLDVDVPEIPPARGVLPAFSDPVRFGRSDTISFSPIGTSSSGTLYVSDGRRALAAVVLYGGTGRIRAWRYDLEQGVWRR